MPLLLAASPIGAAAEEGGDNLLREIAVFLTATAAVLSSTPKEGSGVQGIGKGMGESDAAHFATKSRRSCSAADDPIDSADQRNSSTLCIMAMNVASNVHCNPWEAYDHVCNQGKCSREQLTIANAFFRRALAVT
eukprot:TRINITY_DN33365_c0_g1_i1.p1 TRINITY_DN33365_c0_g1~~TRINITY_DN33365_c0_g1_i1.p1  ORF type:complete len:135 (-),score=21.99 TRINITY_DN33365_c0_g1_i1:267-671(-)